MGRFVARQPNGKLCVFSTIVDTVIFYNITEEEYIEKCAEEAREEAMDNIKSKGFIKDFKMVKEFFRPSNDTREKFLTRLREMGDNETKPSEILDYDVEEID